MATRIKGLGRGLDALLGVQNAAPQGEAGTQAAPVGDMLATLAIDRLQRGKYQPRTKMDEASLNELAESIRSQGLMQPILVRPIGGSGDNTRYEIIAGERRWRAAQIAGLPQVPVVIREVPDQAAAAMALIENIQREDLGPLEEAAGVQRLVAEFNLTHEQAAQAIGRSRAATTNLLRLLQLSRPVQALLNDGKLEMGHARALLALTGHQQETVANQVAEAGMSVRQTEKLVQDILNPNPRVPKKKLTPRDIARFAEELSERMGTKVEIKSGAKGRGRLVIHYSSNEHLDDLLARIK
jgi:ParB family chromosome partitioning protein